MGRRGGGTRIRGTTTGAAAAAAATAAPPAAATAAAAAGAPGAAPDAPPAGVNPCALCRSLQKKAFRSVFLAKCTSWDLVCYRRHAAQLLRGLAVSDFACCQGCHAGIVFVCPHCPCSVCTAKPDSVWHHGTDTAGGMTAVGAATTAAAAAAACRAATAAPRAAATAPRPAAATAAPAGRWRPLLQCRWCFRGQLRLRRQQGFRGQERHGTG